jgi:hypothetical protein
VNTGTEMTLWIVGVVGATSLISYVVGSRSLGLPTTDLGAALRKMLDCIGTILIFTVLNLATGAAAILGARFLIGRFVSLYFLNDDTWVVLSALQGLTWALWRQAGRHRRSI